MKVVPLDLPEILLIEPDVYRDPRGFFLETYQAQEYRAAGIAGTFVQDNHSRSVHRTVRGLHAQSQRPQGKLLRVLHGEIFDVVVDIRRGSPRYLKWLSVILSADNFRQVYIPPGFAHGLCVTSEYADVAYKCTDYYDPSDELNILWNDPAIGVVWPTVDPLLSDKDRRAPRVAEVEAQFPQF